MKTLKDSELGISKGDSLTSDKGKTGESSKDDSVFSVLEKLHDMKNQINTVRYLDENASSFVIPSSHKYWNLILDYIDIFSTLLSKENLFILKTQDKPEQIFIFWENL